MSYKVNIQALILLCALVAPSAWAQQVELAPDHPDRHVVQKGDTLWDIAQRFLARPWRWPEIWQINPQIENPHLIYPGDVVLLQYDGDRPFLAVQRGAGVPTAGSTRRGPREQKLSPRIGVERRTAQAIPTLPLDMVVSFLLYPMVVEKAEFESRPHVQAVGPRGEELLAVEGEYIYVRGELEQDVSNFNIYRGGQEYRGGPSGDEFLGYEVRYIGEVEIELRGDPSRGLLVRSEFEIKGGDRLYPNIGGLIEDSYSAFLPRSPGQPVKGSILSVVDGGRLPQEYQVVVLDLGEREGLESGHVLGLYRKGNVLEDKYAPVEQGLYGDAFEKRQIPELRSGVAMVFRVFPRVSYALVMELEREVYTGDIVRNP